MSTGSLGQGISAAVGMALADRIDQTGARVYSVLGDDELEQGKAELKNMKTGEKKKISLDGRFLDDYLTAVTEQEDLSF